MDCRPVGQDPALPKDPLSHHLATMAYNNAWANHRLLATCATLDAASFAATRTSFFPSIRATLNHIVTVDWFYVDALEREAGGQPPHPDRNAFFEPEEPFGDCAGLALAQRAVDLRLIDYCTSLDDASLLRVVPILRPQSTQREPRTRLLAHLFQHQIHHRGQVHAMLAGTSVKPPPLDEFFCVIDTPLRAHEFAALGFTEEALWSSH